MSDVTQTPPEEPAVQEGQGEVPGRDPAGFVPGLDKMTWAMATDLGLTENDDHLLKICIHAKQTFRNVHIIFLAGRPHIHRTVGRLEFRNLMQRVGEKVSGLVEAARKEERDDLGMYSQQMARQVSEDELVKLCCIHPAYNELSLRDEDAGIISSLHDSIQLASGFNQDTVPIKL